MTSRRRVLRGLAGGVAASVSVPLLDCFLNTNGTALAGGEALPVRFGTWTWGCGMTSSRWVPKAVGANYDVPIELAGIGSLKHKVNILSGFTVKTDGKENKPHVSGAVGIRTGTAPTGPTIYSQPTIDLLVSDVVGGGTRFRSLDMAATGNPEHSYSARSTSVINASIPSAAALYARVFGPDFQNPNAAAFTPDPNTLVRSSVLSVVKDERDAFMKNLGAADRARLDQYFTSVRQLEQQLALQLEKPQPLKACSVPAAPQDLPPGTEISVVAQNHKLMSAILAHALACNQTRVFNMVFSDFTSSLRKQGSAETHHGITHEETADPKLGYQVEASWFVEQTMNGWAVFLAALDAIPEGSGTLLDNTIVFAHSDTQFARSHTLDGIPMMTAGSGGGQLRTGLHIAGNGDAATRAGLTLQQVMKVPVERWGSGALETAKPISEILV
ncbi:MAG: DUF1552 domain-containing protein [Rhodospirillaceae bacterium]|nr:DUF1552 domain-containing protein [Rhodospirillaceae bacterium]